MQLLTGSASKYVLCSSSFGLKPSTGSAISGLACRKWGSEMYTGFLKGSFKRHGINTFSYYISLSEKISLKIKLFKLKMKCKVCFEY